MFCSKCGKELNDGSLFCPKCGTKVSSFGAESDSDNRCITLDEQDDSANNIETQHIQYTERNHSQNSSEGRQTESQELTKGPKSGLAVIFDYRVYLSIVAVLTIVAVVLGRINMDRNMPEDEASTFSDMYGITGDLSRFIGADEEDFLIETGMTKNDDGFYPSMNDMAIYFDDGKVSTITLNNHSGVSLDECSLFGLKIGDVLEDVEGGLSQYEYVDTQNDSIGGQSTKIDMYRIRSDNSMIMVTYADWDHTIISMNYISGFSEEDWGLDTNTDVAFDEYDSQGVENDNIEIKSIDTQELMDSIMVYYALYYGSQFIDAEVDNEDKDSVTIRIFDPYETTTSNTLGLYTYDKKIGVWTDAVTGEILDFNDASDTHNARIEETLPEYFVYVNAPDGYVNLRTGPGTEYDIICPIQNGEALELYPEEATSKNGKKWAKVAYYTEDDWITGYVIASQIDY